MVAGAAFFCYATAASFLLLRDKGSALGVTVGAMPVWFAVAFGLVGWGGCGDWGKALRSARDEGA